MTTTTVERTDLDRAIVERALAELNDPAAPMEAERLQDAALAIVDLVAGAYEVYETGTDVRVGQDWVERIRGQLMIGIMADVRASLIPKAATRMADLLEQDPPPAHLVAHERSGDLRADLAQLEAGR